MWRIAYHSKSPPPVCLSQIFPKRPPSAFPSTTPSVFGRPSLPSLSDRSTISVPHGYLVLSRSYSLYCSGSLGIPSFPVYDIIYHMDIVGSN